MSFEGHKSVRANALISPNTLNSFGFVDFLPCSSTNGFRTFCPGFRTFCPDNSNHMCNMVCNSPSAGHSGVLDRELTFEPQGTPYASC